MSKLNSNTQSLYRRIYEFGRELGYKEKKESTKRLKGLVFITQLFEIPILIAIYHMLVNYIIGPYTAIIMICISSIILYGINARIFKK